MFLADIITSKPVLIGLHLALGIIGIDAFLWVLGELVVSAKHRFRMKLASMVGVAGFILSWIAGGYYYVTYYGSQVKPIIKSGLAPWGHLVFMEVKEHIFLLIPPLALTALVLVFLKKEDFVRGNMRSVSLLLVGLIVFLGLAVGAMGFIVSAAARWGII